MNIKEDFRCKYCYETFEDPVSLFCCGENVCKKHIDELLLQTTNVSCMFCSEALPRKEFHINKILKNLIDRELHNLTIDQKYEDVLEQLKKKINQIENMHDDPKNAIYTKFSELKRQVDLDRENAKLKIDESADEIINKLDSYETELKVGCKSISDSEYNASLVANMKNKLAEYERILRSLSKSNQDRENKCKEIKHAAYILETEIQEYEFKLFNNKTLEYEPMKDIIGLVFGKLVVKTEKENNLDSKNLVRTLEGHTAYVYGLIGLENGSMASGSSDSTIKIWNVNDGRSIKTINNMGSIWAMIKEDGCLITAGHDKIIRIWDIKESKLVKSLEGHKEGIWALKLLKNGTLASASEDQTIKIWDLVDGRLIKTLKGHTDWVLSLEVLDNNCLASGSSDKTIKIWDVDDESVIRTLKGHQSGIYSLKLMNSENLISGSADKTINIWNVTNATLIGTLIGHTDHVRALELLNNDYLASGSFDKTIKIWDLNDGKLIKTLEGHTDKVVSLRSLENGDLVSGSGDKTIKIWNKSMLNF